MFCPSGSEKHNFKTPVKKLSGEDRFLDSHSEGLDMKLICCKFSAVKKRTKKKKKKKTD